MLSSFPKITLNFLYLYIIEVMGILINSPVLLDALLHRGAGLRGEKGPRGRGRGAFFNFFFTTVG